MIQSAKSNGNTEHLRFAQLPAGAWHFTGRLQNAARQIEQVQLLDSELWTVFVNQYRHGIDGNGNGWRGEFWGKMMRGACMTYAYTQNEALYQTLESTVRDMLSAAEADGRIASYSRETELHGWDMWCRKYVLLGMAYFLEICRDDVLRDEIVAALCKETDLLMEAIGPESEGKIPITKTSGEWGGLNASSILEPVVRLYNLTGEKKYLDFAAHIVECGGSTAGNVFELAAEGKIPPNEYPVTKAYEMMSCFEGLLEYYYVTGEEKWRQAVVNFTRLAADHEISIIGSAGSLHELFDGAGHEQSNPSHTCFMQETCVTVTWMKLCYRVFCLTGDSRLVDEIERSAYNAMLGSLQQAACKRPKFPFDSYSPLFMGRRARGTAGAMSFAGSHDAKKHPRIDGYGCCVSIGSAGTALPMLASVMSAEDGLAVNLFLPGRVEAALPSGQKARLQIDTQYPDDGRVSVTVDPEEAETFTLYLRIPAWSASTRLSVNGESVSCTPGDYAALCREWHSGDRIELMLDLRGRLLKASEACTNPAGREMAALMRGPVVLARDARLGEQIDQKEEIQTDGAGFVELVPASTPDWAVAAYHVPTRGGSITVVDYPSCSTTWDAESMATVWMPTQKAQQTCLTRPVIAANIDDLYGLMTVTGLDGKLSLTHEKGDVWRLEPVGGTTYRIGLHDGRYLTAVSGADGDAAEARDASQSADQLWKVERTLWNQYIIYSAASGRCLTRKGGTLEVQLSEENGSDKQIWRLENPSA